MTITGRSGTGTAVARPGALRAYRIIAHIIPLLVLVQAVLAGRLLWAGADVRGLHGQIGNLVFLLAVAQVVLALLAGLAGRERRALIGASVVLVLLLVLQLGLGYAGRDGGEPAAWHIPLGVLIFGLTAASVSLALRAGRGATAV